MARLIVLISCLALTIGSIDSLDSEDLNELAQISNLAREYTQRIAENDGLRSMKSMLAYLSYIFQQAFDTLNQDEECRLLRNDFDEIFNNVVGVSLGMLNQCAPNPCEVCNDSSVPTEGPFTDPTTTFNPTTEFPTEITSEPTTPEVSTQPTEITTEQPEPTTPEVSTQPTEITTEQPEPTTTEVSKQPTEITTEQPEPTTTEVSKQPTEVTTEQPKPTARRHHPEVITEKFTHIYTDWVSVSIPDDFDDDDDNDVTTPSSLPDDNDDVL